MKVLKRFAEEGNQWYKLRKSLENPQMEIDCETFGVASALGRLLYRAQTENVRYYKQDQRPDLFVEWTEQFGDEAGSATNMLKPDYLPDLEDVPIHVAFVGAVLTSACRTRENSREMTWTTKAVYYTLAHLHLSTTIAANLIVRRGNLG
jgi:hypothetical protein